MGLLTLPKTFAESPYAARAGLAKDNAAAPCACDAKKHRRGDAGWMGVVSTRLRVCVCRRARATTHWMNRMDAWRNDPRSSARARRSQRARVRDRALRCATRVRATDIFTRIYLSHRTRALARTRTPTRAADARPIPIRSPRYPIASHRIASHRVYVPRTRSTLHDATTHRRWRPRSRGARCAWLARGAA